MVIKTDTCFFTEFKIYPGHGRRLIRKDGKLLAFINQKVRSLYTQKIKAQRLTWSQQWRRRHKKGKVETVAKKRVKRSTKVYKAIQGIDLEALKKKRTVKADVRQAGREANLRELKERKRKTKEETKKTTARQRATTKKAAAAPAGFVKVPKQRRQAMAKGARSTGR